MLSTYTYFLRFTNNNFSRGKYRKIQLLYNLCNIGDFELLLSLIFMLKSDRVYLKALSIQYHNYFCTLAQYKTTPGSGLCIHDGTMGSHEFAVATS